VKSPLSGRRSYIWRNQAKSYKWLQVALYLQPHGNTAGSCLWRSNDCTTEDTLVTINEMKIWKWLQYLLMCPLKPVSQLNVWLYSIIYSNLKPVEVKRKKQSVLGPKYSPLYSMKYTKCWAMCENICCDSVTAKWPEMPVCSYAACVASGSLSQLKVEISWREVACELSRRDSVMSQPALTFCAVSYICGASAVSQWNNLGEMQLLFGWLHSETSERRAERERETEREISAALTAVSAELVASAWACCGSVGCSGSALARNSHLCSPICSSQ